ncbi:MAG: bifunctional 23S rRNA (guanine(2069)-N(7))-methyltransferase RlmK/23S rRNA (guanine(2445)-N(2))-methyltransferase RlmL [Steroidobacteraceae bacterium]
MPPDIETVASAGSSVAAAPAGAIFDLQVSCPRGFGDLLAEELRALGAEPTRIRSGRNECRGDLGLAYAIYLHSRLASRVFVTLARFESRDQHGYYRGARSVHWRQHLVDGATIACDYSGIHAGIDNTQFGALRLKDAICDSMREATGRRPDVAPHSPDLRLHAHASTDEVTLAIDLGGALHRRGYRSAGGPAPLRENLAAGILMRAGWQQRMQQGATLLDPMCGSGTLVIEAALMALAIAPGTLRGEPACRGWRLHQPALWQQLRIKADAMRRPAGALIVGRDRDALAIAMARGNAARAGVADSIDFGTADLSQLRRDRDWSAAGLMVTNPPYGVRLDDKQAARETFRQLGEVLRGHFQGWSAAVVAGGAGAGLELGLRARRRHRFWNGTIECELLRLEVDAGSQRDMRPKPGGLRIDMDLADSPGAIMLANRITKNLKRLRAWAQREDVTCYRIYDADMPEYAFAIDRYLDEKNQSWFYVQEYAAPASIAPDAVRRRRNEALAGLARACKVEPAQLVLRTRRRTRRGEQYQREENAAVELTVREGGLNFLVRLGEYLDTGLFLDHRATRARIRNAAKDVDFLNLFAYTGSATVYAASGGARSTTTVDMSQTYLDWAQRNMQLNGYQGPRHRFIRADCRDWLRQASRISDRYGLVFLDPPTFSNSKRMTGSLDVLRDHAALVAMAMGLLTEDGTLIFSVNAQRFALASELRERFEVQDVSRSSVPADFERNLRIHQCFIMRRRPATH